jgi:hypothetical protein
LKFLPKSSQVASWPSSLSTPLLQTTEIQKRKERAAVEDPYSKEREPKKKKKKERKEELEKELVGNF